MILLVVNQNLVAELDIEPEEIEAMLRGLPVNAEGRTRVLEGIPALLRASAQLGARCF
jgi:hypothetical protein